MGLLAGGSAKGLVPNGRDCNIFHVTSIAMYFSLAYSCILKIYYSNDRDRSLRSTFILQEPILPV